MANPLDAFAGSLGFNFTATPGDNITGSAFSQVSTNDNIVKNYTFSTGVGANQSNQYFRSLFVLAASANTTINMLNFINALNLSGSTFARLKALRFRLLTAVDDATNGTAASSVTIGNSGVNGHPMFLGADTHTIVLANGATVAWCNPSAGGVVVNTADRDILIVNNDSSLSAAVEVLIVGGET